MATASEVTNHWAVVLYLTRRLPLSVASELQNLTMAVRSKTSNSEDFYARQVAQALSATRS